MSFYYVVTLRNFEQPDLAMFVAAEDADSCYLYENFDGVITGRIIGYSFLEQTVVFTYCIKASVSDNDGLLEMLTLNIDYFKSKPATVAKLTILVDHEYQQKKIKQGKSGFVAVATQWIIERSEA